MWLKTQSSVGDQHGRCVTCRPVICGCQIEKELQSAVCESVGREGMKELLFKAAEETGARPVTFTRTVVNGASVVPVTQTEGVCVSFCVPSIMTDG